MTPELSEGEERENQTVNARLSLSPLVGDVEVQVFEEEEAALPEGLVEPPLRRGEGG